MQVQAPYPPTFHAIRRPDKRSAIRHAKTRPPSLLFLGVPSRVTKHPQPQSAFRRKTTAVVSRRRGDPQFCQISLIYVHRYARLVIKYRPAL